MTSETSTLPKKKPYSSPTLTVHGNVEKITLGDDLGEDLDAAFATTSASQSISRGKKKPKHHNRFS